MTATLATVRTQLRNRFGFSANDPLFPDETLNRQINLAQRKIARAHNWWWATSEVVVENDTGDDVEVWPAQFATPNDTYQVRDVGSVFVSDDGDYWLPLDRMTGNDAVLETGGRVPSAGMPEVWSVVALTGTTGAGDRQQVGIRFAPALPAGAWLRFEMTVDTIDLAADGDTLAMWPSQVVDLVVEIAGTTLLRKRREATKRRGGSMLPVAERAVADWSRAARARFARPYEGAGRAQQESSR